MHHLSTMFLLWLRINFSVDFFSFLIAAVCQPQVLAWLSIFWLLIVTNFQKKTQINKKDRQIPWHPASHRFLGHPHLGVASSIENQAKSWLDMGVKFSFTAVRQNPFLTRVRSKQGTAVAFQGQDNESLSWPREETKEVASLQKKGLQTSATNWLTVPIATP